MSRFNLQVEQQAIGQNISRAIFGALCGACIVLGPLSTTPLFAQTPPANAKTTFLVVRHAERDGNLDKLTKVGEERSKVLASMGRALNVQVIYSTDTQRTKGTVQPLAKDAGIDVRTYEKPSVDWIASLKRKHSGKVVLIVGHSNTAGVIAGLLAKEDPFVISHDEYDALFIIQAANEEASFMRLNYGRSSKGASAADHDKMGVLESSRGAK